MKTAIDRYSFRGAMTGGAAGWGPWAIADTSAAGTPTYTGANLGGFFMANDAQDEVQNICLSFGNVLSYDIDDLIAVEFIAQCSATLNAVCTIVMGVGSARNDDPDAVAANAWFRLEGSNALLVESDDGTNDNDDVATGQTLVNAWKRFRIEFAEGVFTASPPTLSVGGKGDVRFYVDDGRGRMRRVAANTRFNMENYAVGLQPIIQLQKTGSANIGTVGVLEYSVEYKVTA